MGNNEGRKEIQYIYLQLMLVIEYVFTKTAREMALIF
jgi:hypothetical protein